MFLIALTLSLVMQPDRWIPVGGGTDQKEYLDRESVKRSGAKVTLFTRREIPAEKAIVWQEMEFDCARRTETLIAWIRDDDGTVSHNTTRPHRAAAPIAPGSTEERLFTLACR
jgi:hypothetical protein